MTQQPEDSQDVVEAIFGAWADTVEDIENGEYDGAYEPTPGGEDL